MHHVIPSRCAHWRGVRPRPGQNITALFYYTSPIKRTIVMKKHRDIEPSMLQDLKHGKSCGIEAINGRIVEVVKETQEGKRLACGENIGVLDDAL